MFLTINSALSLDKFNERALFIDNPRALSHIFFLDSLNTDFDPFSSQRIGYAFFKNDWMEYSSFKFKQAFNLAQSRRQKDKIIFWYGLSYLRFGMLDELYQEMSEIDIPWARLWTGLALFDRGEINQAQKLLEELLIKRDLEKILALEAKYILGLCYLKQSKMNIASETFNSILEEYPRSILTGEIYFRLALVEIENGKLERAKFSLENCLNFYEDSDRKESHWWIEQMYYLLSSINIKTGDYEKARKYASELQKKFPDSKYIEKISYIKVLANISEKGVIDSVLLIPDNLPSQLRWDINMRIGFEYFEKGEYENAQRYFLGAISSARENEERLQTFMYLGEVNYETKNYENAHKYFRQASNSKTNFSRKARWGFAWASVKIKSYEQAQEAFKEVYEGYDDDLARRANFQYAMTFYTTKQYTKAIQELDEFRSSGGAELADDAAFYALKAQAQKGDTIKYFNRLRDFLLDYPSSKFVKDMAIESVVEMIDAELYQMAQDVGEVLSERDYESLKSDSLYYLTMKASLFNGDYTEIKDYLEEFLQGDPENHLLVDVFSSAADSFELEGNNQEAIAIWEKLRAPEASDSIYAFASYRQAKCLLRMNDIYGAKPNIDQLIGELPEYSYAPLGMFEIGDWYTRKQRFGEAIDYYQKVKMLYPDTKYDKMADIRLAELYMQIGKFEESREILSTIPNDSLYSEIWKESVILTMESFILEGTYDRALKYYDEMSKTVDDETVCMLDEKKAIVNIQLGNIFKADSIFKSISEKEEKCGQIEDGGFYYIWGEALSRTHEKARACSLLSIVYENDNPDSLQRKARLKIYEIQEKKD